jgi:glutathione S-transferase
VDAFFAPVVFRIQTYRLQVDTVSQAYMARMLELAAMRTWYAEALLEPWRDRPHDAEIEQHGEVVEDLRRV